MTTSILATLQERATKESTPIYDQLLADVGSLLSENPWQAHLVEFTGWDLPADYELPPLPLHMQLDRIRRQVSSRFDTQLMQVIS